MDSLKCLNKKKKFFKCIPVQGGLDFIAQGTGTGRYKTKTGDHWY